jgi:histone H3/H4
MAEMLVVQSKIKEVARKMDINMSGDFAEVLSKKVEEAIKEAANRAKANGRKTLRGYDL